MKILMLAQFYPPVIGGEERHVRNLSVELAARGHDVHVGTLDLGEADLPTQDAGVTVHRLDNLGRRMPRLYADPTRPLAMPLPDPSLSRALGRLTRELNPDVVHAHNWIVNSYLPVQRAHARPLVLSLHDYSHVCATKRMMTGSTPCGGPSVKNCLPCVKEHYGVARGGVIWSSVRAGVGVRERLVDRFTPVSRAVQQASGLAGRPELSEVVPNFVPDALVSLPLQPRDARLPAEPYLFFAGDLSAEKGLLTLLEAYRRLPVGRPKLVLVGRPTPDLPDTLPEGVELHRGWDHSRIVSAFQHCLAAVLPSEWPDPCPTTVLEAMALGAPLVTTHEGGIADMVVDGRSALVVRPGDPAALAGALDRLIGDPALREQLRAGGRRDVLGFLGSAVADQLLGVYSSLVPAVSNVA